MEPIVSIDIDDSGVRKQINQLSRRVADLTPAMQEIGEYMILAHDRRFELEQDYLGQPLKPLSKFTLEKKKSMGRILKILQSTGLMRSRTNYRVSRNSVVIGNTDSKAAKHQLGINVPQRQIFGINPIDDVPEITAILDNYLAG